MSRIARRVAERQLRMGPSLTEATMHAFERRYGIELPSGFRWFLTTVGNGADGPPAYGLLPLGDLPDDLSLDERQAWGYEGRLDRPFPFTQPWIWEGGEETDEGDETQLANGSLFLGTDGCAMYWHLIVTGPERGNVWLIADVGIQPTEPKRDFLQWFEDWLDGRTDWFL